METNPEEYKNKKHSLEDGVFSFPMLSYIIIFFIINRVPGIIKAFLGGCNGFIDNNTLEGFSYIAWPFIGAILLNMFLEFYFSKEDSIKEISSHLKNSVAIIGILILFCLGNWLMNTSWSNDIDNTKACSPQAINE